jgi:hypothetical protein
MLSLITTFPKAYIHIWHVILSISSRFAITVTR